MVGKQPANLQLRLRHGRLICSSGRILCAKHPRRSFLRGLSKLGFRSCSNCISVTERCGIIRAIRTMIIIDLHGQSNVASIHRAASNELARSGSSLL